MPRSLLLALLCAGCASPWGAPPGGSKSGEHPARGCWRVVEAAAQGSVKKDALLCFGDAEVAMANDTREWTRIAARFTVVDETHVRASYAHGGALELERVAKKKIALTERWPAAVPGAKETVAPLGTAQRLEGESARNADAYFAKLPTLPALREQLAACRRQLAAIAPTDPVVTNPATDPAGIDNTSSLRNLLFLGQLSFVRHCQPAPPACVAQPLDPDADKKLAAATALCAK